MEQITNQVCSLCKETGQYILKEREILNNDMIGLKGINNLVSTVDIESEKKLIKGLNTILPGCQILAEESQPDNISKELTWVIDPIDGTTNFVHGIPCYAISIALMKDNEILLGVVYEINQNECFYAWKNSAAFLNGDEIQVSTNKDLVRCLIATGFPYDQEMNLDGYVNIMRDIIKNTRGIRRLGSAAVDLAYVAAGRFDGFYEVKLNPWDVAAGSLIVERAGGAVCDFKGTKNHVFGKSIIAGNQTAIDYLLKISAHY